MTNAANNNPPPLRRLRFDIAVGVGVLGVLICVAACAAIWVVGSGLNRANEKVFEMVDTSLATVQDRVSRLQRRAEDSRITADELRHSVQNWAKKETAEHLAARLEVAEKAESLSSGLQQAALMLDISLESLQRAGRAVELSNTLGAWLDPKDIKNAVAKLASLQEKVQTASKTVDQVRDHAVKLSGGDDQKSTRDQILQLIVRVVATLGEINKLLEGIVDRLDKLRMRSGKLKAKTHDYIVALEIASSLLVAWMAVGQGMICRYGWNNWRGMKS